jgi:hypothetical protein
VLWPGCGFWSAVMRPEPPDVLVKSRPGQAENAGNRCPASTFLGDLPQARLYPVQVHPGCGQHRHGAPDIRSRGWAAVAGVPANGGTEHGGKGVLIAERP